jgi:23S rRNA U2552 (ribose-2'-O)-methylase RlmE/FtsJ
MMQNIGLELQGLTGAFNVTGKEAGHQSQILDLCMAPGGFLFAAMQCNPDAIATASTLPFEPGGHRVLLPENEHIKITMLDITMLAADLGADHIPKEHPDSANFLPKQFSGSREFDIVLCDGQVLRTLPKNTLIPPTSSPNSSLEVESSTSYSATDKCSALSHAQTIVCTPRAVGSQSLSLLLGLGISKRAALWWCFSTDWKD